jgi:hypothetical protein
MNQSLDEALGPATIQLFLIEVVRVKVISVDVAVDAFATVSAAIRESLHHLHKVFSVICPLS